MPDPDNATYRTYRAAGDAVELREELEDDEDVFEVRMPIASTGDVRNEGDDPLDREVLEGFATQLENRQIGVFPGHGTDSMITDGRYSPFERLGDWRGGEVETRDEGEDVLLATARMPDPETLPEATGSYREALAILKEQAARGIAQDASIGWREDDDFPGGNDLMEASIVGIGADWRTNTGDESAAVARAAVDAGADPETLVETVKRAVSEDARELTDEQVTLALDLIDRFVDEQGDASVENFDRWVWSQDDDIDPDAAHAAQTAIGEFCRAMSPMDDPVSETLRPWLEDGGDTDSMTDDDTGDEAGTTDGEQDAPDEGDETDERADAEAFREEMLEMQTEQTDLLRELVDRETDEDGDGDDDDDGGEDDDDDEQAAEDPDATQSADDGEADADDETDYEQRIADLESELEATREAIREGDTDVIDQPEPDDEQDADDADDDTDDPNRDAEDGSDGFDNLGDYR